MNEKVATITMNPSIDKTITIEKLVPYGLNRVKTSRIDPGGKGINVAKVLHNFGIDVTVSGLIAGEQGKLLMGFLNDAGMTVDFLEVNGETRTNIKMIDESVGKTTEVNETGFLVQEESLTAFKEKFRWLMKQVSVVVLGGSLPPGVPGSFYADCISVAKEEGVITLLDADGSALTEGIKAVPFAVKPNIHELEAVTGRTFSDAGDVVNAAKGLIETGISIVIVSMGADGAIVCNRNEVYKVDSWDADIKSTVGAGDSMVGALAYSILKNKSLFEIAKVTTAAGTITASKAGTQICTLDEVLTSIGNVTVTQIQ